MKGWGRACFWFGFGVWLVSGCGGRTDALGGDIYGDDDDSTSGASPGVGGGSAGTSTKAGASGRGGGRPVGGSAPVGGGGASFAGTGPGYGGVAGYGGFGVAGAGFGGTFGGTGFGGTGFAGSFPGGGFAGFGGSGFGGTSSVDCESCLVNACSPQLTQCFQDYGCVAVFGCLATTGCNAAQCYTPQYCKNTIDMFGGPGGPAMRELLQVFTCGFTAGCQCQ